MSLSIIRDPVKILVEMLHGIGDTVCALPMLALLRNTYPVAEIIVLVKNTAGQEILLASHIHIDEIHVLDVYKNPAQAIRLLWNLRTRKFDYGISSCVTPVRKARIFMKIVQPKRAVGWQQQGLYFDVLRNRYHFVEAYLLSVRAICVLPVEKQYPRLFVNQDVVRNLKSRIALQERKLLIGVCIGNADYSLKNRWLRCGKVYTKAWGIKKMIELVCRLQQLGYGVLLIGGKAEVPLVIQLKDALDSMAHIYDFVGQTNLQGSIALAWICHCVVGVDTGMQHVAAAVGTRTVSIFGPTNPAVQGPYAEHSVYVESRKCPYCYGTKNYVDCQERKCLDAVSVDMVAEAVRKVIQREAEGNT